MAVSLRRGYETGRAGPGDHLVESRRRAGGVPLPKGGDLLEKGNPGGTFTLDPSITGLVQGLGKSKGAGSGRYAPSYEAGQPDAFAGDSLPGGGTGVAGDAGKPPAEGGMTKMQMAAGAIHLASGLMDYRLAGLEAASAHAGLDLQDARLDIERDVAVRAQRDRLQAMGREAGRQAGAVRAAQATSGVDLSSKSARAVRKYAKSVSEADVLAAQASFASQMMGYSAAKWNVRISRQMVEYNKHAARAGAMMRTSASLAKLAAPVPGA